MNWAERHRLWHVLGALVVLVVVALLAFCGEGSRPLGMVQESTTEGDARVTSVPRLEVPRLEVPERPDPPAEAKRHTPRVYKATPVPPPPPRLRESRSVQRQIADKLTEYVRKIRDGSSSLADRLAALRHLQSYGVTTLSIWYTKDGIPLPERAKEYAREWPLALTYELADLDAGEARALVLEGLRSPSTSIRTHAVPLVKTHTFTALELNPVLGAVVRSDDRASWLTAEQILDRLTITPRDADDLVMDWESAFADGGPKRRRFLLGLGARLKPHPSRLRAFLHAALSDEHRDVRASAVNALGRLGLEGDDVGQSLVHASTDPDERVAQLATEWIGTLRK